MLELYEFAQDQRWATSMVDHLLEIKETVDAAQEAGLECLIPKPRTSKQRRGRRKQTKCRNLLDHFGPPDVAGGDRSSNSS